MMSKEFWIMVNPFMYVIFTALAVNLGISLNRLISSAIEFVDSLILCKHKRK